MDPSVVIQIVILIILLILSAFFSSAETALTTVNKIKMKSMADEGNKKAQIVLDITDDPSKLLGAILIGNNIVNLSASSITTTLALSFGAGTIVAIATGILTILILIFGEIVPKTMANVKSEKMALLYARPIYYIMKICNPVNVIINCFAKIIFLILRIDPNDKGEAITEDELRILVDVGHEEGVLEEEEKEMIHNVFDLGDARAKDVMVPKIHMIAMPIDSSHEDLLNVFRKERFTRIPIYEESVDNIVGIVNMKDFVLIEKENFDIKTLMHDVYLTHEHKNISELLIDMRKSSFNMAIVLDEYGETAGLITLENILEEIVGDIYDEYDETEEEYFKTINEKEWMVDGSVSLNDFNDRLNIAVESDYDTIGGYIIEKLDKLPDVDDEVLFEDKLKLIVKTVDKNRVENIHVIAI